ncbi:hypothetical protein [Sutcliffiella rhizosphaerae]|uniref:Uncharacterized protein n=1 Tax=Sutcliffiella rhizosphaerae TaxID=2880967 RepID=A0ABN8A908_9BACI|nr:hypothetical protein [Sutcliffiella rhizosphaerae]CAG9621584.1 hypothetical protein BACCIP111883_02357 [Sutcliffiella rhizosphaerae]
MKKIFVLVIGILSLIIPTIGAYILSGYIQYILFVPDDFLLWTFKYPYARFVLLFLLLFAIVFFRLVFDRFIVNNPKKKWGNSQRIIFIGTFVILFYISITSITVVTKQQIVDHTFWNPIGKEYNLEDVVSIEAGIREDRFYFPFTHNKGDFFRIRKWKSY